MADHDPHTYRARVVDVAPDLPPVDARVVSDVRDKRGKRLALLAFGLVVVALLAIGARAVGVYVKDADEARVTAQQQRAALLDQADATAALARETALASADLRATVEALRQVVADQSRTLAEAGLVDAAVAAPVPAAQGETPRTGVPLPVTPGAAPRPAQPRPGPAPRPPAPTPRPPLGPPAPRPVTPLAPFTKPLGIPPLVCLRLPPQAGQVCL